MSTWVAKPAAELVGVRIADEAVSITELRRHPGRILRAVDQGRVLTVTFRRRAVARLIPLRGAPEEPSPKDPFYRLGDYAEPMGRMTNAQIDEAIYGP